ncbi:MAG: hypothetical protein DHS20C02_10560 [Micavibrio sp.]|nr:MAG: hypothetical protein DHS20C02_10560 [Micavibrio sp.]
MLISKAYAAAEEVSDTLAGAPGAGEAFAWNMGLVLVLVVLFYVLLIMPQQKRFKEHSQMLQGLKKGDKVVTGGGLVGKIEKIEEGNDEVVVDLGSGMKVTALRSTIHGKDEPLLRDKPSNDPKEKKKSL